jgi:hypothetical protein
MCVKTYPAESQLSRSLGLVKLQPAPATAGVSVNWRLQYIAVIDLACPYNFAGRPSALTCGAHQ